MIKITTGLTILFLLLIGCAEDNPFKANPDAEWESGIDHPHIILAGTESNGFGNHQFTDLNPEIEGIQDAIILKFDEAMDAATIIASSFNLIPTDPEGALFQFDSIEYYPENETAVLSGTFSDDTAYLLTVIAGGTRNLVGKELDPNHNALYDGSPWDDRLITFVAGTAEMRDIISPVINSHYPVGGGQVNQNPEITIIFLQGPMDVSLLNLDNITLVRTSDSTAVSLELSSATENEIVVVPTDRLSYGTRYTIRQSAQVADSTGNYLDTDGNGYIWPDEADFVWDIQMEDDSNTNATPPTVAAAFKADNNVVIEFEQSLTGNDVVMDEITYTGANIQISDDSGSIPLRFEGGSNPATVYCLLQRNYVGSLTVHVSCNVADQYGNLLDGNNDGLGGTPGEDDWSGVL
ncbi:MAG: Ig-like domain-containing protein [Candidatus Aegiribacteria sp.]|nr:Ig-like domain-containing protein [Candidatus Aegiribacteria sp.]